ncbi:hypothetical protein [Actinomyces naeslundii]|nr:hypothetical protein [Actinomyces naeslundii]
MQVFGAFVLICGVVCLAGSEKPLGFMLVVGSLSLVCTGRAGKP